MKRLFFFLFFLFPLLFPSPLLAQQKIDPRFGVTHIAGLYPDVNPNYLPYGIQEIGSLNFQTAEITISPEQCLFTSLRPNGFYGFEKSTSYCSDSKKNGMTSFIKNPLYYQVLNNSNIKNIFITANPLLDQSLSPWILKSEFSDDLLEQKLAILYRDFYNLTTYLLTNFSTLNKRIILMTPNELDWHLIPDKNTALDISTTASQNAIAYLNTISDAINQAKRDHPFSALSVYHACEVNRVYDALEGKKRAVNTVLPYTRCDLYGYSIYDTLFQDNDRLLTSFRYLKQMAPDSPSFAANNVFVSEIGVPHEGSNQDYTQAEAVEILNRQIEKILPEKPPFLLYWQIFSNECTKINPSNSDCRGFWLKKPDHQLTTVYEKVFLPRTQPPQSTVKGTLSFSSPTNLESILLHTCTTQHLVSAQKINSSLFSFQFSLDQKSDFCLRPQNLDQFKITINHPVFPDEDSYEWQKAGFDCSLPANNCSPIQQKWDLPSDTAYQFNLISSLPSPSPTSTPSLPTATPLPTSTLPPSSICSSCPPGFPAKSAGNSNCDSAINIADFLAWSQVYKKLLSGSSPSEDELSSVDFNCQPTDTSHTVNMQDFLVWLQSYREIL
jgi:hypothetical protein